MREWQRIWRERTLMMMKVKLSIVSTFIEFDREMYENKLSRGTVCTMILINDIRNIIYQINSGDSRSIIFNDSIISVTDDHTPADQDETNRVLQQEVSSCSEELTEFLQYPGHSEILNLRFIKEQVIHQIMVQYLQFLILSIENTVSGTKLLLTSDAPYEDEAYTIKTLIALYEAHSMDSVDHTAKMLANIIKTRVTDDTTVMVVRL